jgi:lysozyme family protein
MDALGHAARSRRQVLLGAGASLIIPASARAANFLPEPLGRLLGQTLPPELRAIMPAEVFQAAEFVSALMELEAEARRIRLPSSPLSRGEAPITPDLETLYELALPRLVALIDRAEPHSSVLADKAGALLARLHATQHVLPASLGRLTQPQVGDPVLRLDPGSDDAIVLAPDAAGPDPAVIEGPEPGPLPDTGLPTAEVPGGEPRPAPPPAGPVTVSRSLRFADLAGEYAAMFGQAQPRAEHARSLDWHLAMVRQSRRRYETVGARAGVPWYFIAAIHGLEASFNFRAHFHNGDHPLTQRTRQVPAGRPAVWLPPSHWEASAHDALRIMGFAGAADWSLARTLYRLEAYNGFGYRRLGRVSPYLWRFSTHYDRGKFVADGRFSAAARSQQCGAAILLKQLAQAGDIEFA